MITGHRSTECLLPEWRSITVKPEIKTLVLALGLALTAWTQASQASSLYFSGATSVSVGDSFNLSLMGNFPADEPLAGGTIDLGFDGTRLQINTVTIAPYWEFLPESGSQTVFGDNSKWTGIAIATFDNDPISGNNILLATLNLTALAAGMPKLEVLGSTELYEGITWSVLVPTVTAADITVTPAAVPVPPAVWLFATGLLGLVGVGRRKARNF